MTQTRDFPADQQFQRFVQYLDAQEGSKFEESCTTTWMSPVRPFPYAEAFACIEQHGLPVYQVRMNSRDFSDMRCWGLDSGMSPFVSLDDPEEVHEPTIRGTLWNALVITDPACPVGKTFVLANIDGIPRDQIVGDQVGAVARMLAITR